MKYIYIGIILFLLAAVGWLLYERHQKREREKPRKAEGFLAAIKKMIDGFRRIGNTITSFFNRFKYFGQGIAEGGEGVGIAIKNSAIMGAIAIADSFNYGFAGGEYAYNWIACSIEKIKMIHYCIVFYVLDLVIYIIYIIIMSFCALIDAIFRVKRALGIGLVESFNNSLKSLKEADRFVYSYTGVHILTYPEYILNLCYRCQASDEELKRREETLKYDFYVRFPGMTNEFVSKFRQSGEYFKQTFAPF